MTKIDQRVPVEEALFFFTPAQVPFQDYPLAGKVGVVRLGVLSRHTHDIRATAWASNWLGEDAARKNVTKLLEYLEAEYDVIGSTVDDVLDQLELPAPLEPEWW